MPALTQEQLPALASALIRLRGETLAAVSEGTDIRIANLSVWLRGRKHVVSAKRVAVLLHYLGVEGGRLRDDVLHLWKDQGALEQLKIVFDLLQAAAQPAWLFQDGVQTGIARICFLQLGSAWLRVELTPGAIERRELVDVIQPQRVVTLTTSLAGIPFDSLFNAREALLALAEQAAIDVGDEELLDGLMQRLSDSLGDELNVNVASARGWQELDSALRAALHAGIGPGDIARWVVSHVREGNSLLHGVDASSR